MRLILLALPLLAASGCRHSEPDPGAASHMSVVDTITAFPTDTSPRTSDVDLDSALRAAPLPASIDTVLRRGISLPYLALTVPSDATIDSGGILPTGIRGLRIRGPRPPAGTDGPNLPAYELVLATYRNPGHTGLSAWVDSLRREANRELDTDSLTYVAPGAWVRVAADSGLLLDFFCGDCGPSAIYVAHDTLIVGLAFTLEQGRTLSGPEQTSMTLHILDSFHWAP